MDKFQRPLHVGVLLLAAAVMFSGATVKIPFAREELHSNVETSVLCKVENEAFVGWFNVTDNSKIDDKYIDVDKDKNDYYLEFPKGTSAYAGGLYRCQGANNSQILTLEVSCLGKLPSTKNLTFEIGQTKKIEIGCVSYPKTQFAWKKDGAPFDPNSGRFKQDALGTVTFSDVEKLDQAAFELTATWPSQTPQSKVIKFNIAVGKKPVFTETPKSNTVVAALGYNLTLCCKATGDATPTVNWYKQTALVDTSNPSKAAVNDGCLVIKNLQASDAANYTCKAKNQMDEIGASVIVKVSEPAKITSVFKDEQKNTGEDFDVTCTATGSAPLSVDWRKNGVLYSGQEKSAGQSVIKFKGLKTQDTATYMCSAQNDVKFNDQPLVSKKSFKLSVLSKPTVNLQASVTPVYDYIDMGSFKTASILRCQFYGYPEPDVSMKKDGKEVAKGKFTAELSIKPTKKSDFGKYKCEATNSLGTAKHTVEFKEAVKPDPPTSVTAETTCRSVTMRWKAPASDGGLPIKSYTISLSKGSKFLMNYVVGVDDRTIAIKYKFKRASAYNVTILAENDVGVSEGKQQLVLTDEFCVPSPPKITNTNLKVEGAEFRVTWTAPDDNGFDDQIAYQVKWKRMTSIPSRTMNSSLFDVLEFKITNLKNGPHQLQVFAVNRAGASVSDTRNFTVSGSQDGSPTSPPGPEATVKRKGLSKGALAGIVIAIILIVLITIDLLCCFFNSCGLIFCCHKACCGTKDKYEPDGKKNAAEMEKLKGEPEPEQV